MQLDIVQISMANFLKLWQPLPVRYGYSHLPLATTPVLIFTEISRKQRKAIGNTVISEQVVYEVSIKATNVVRIAFYSQILKLALERSEYTLLSEATSRDPDSQSGWEVHLIIQAYNVRRKFRSLFALEEQKEILTKVFDNYLQVMNLYVVTPIDESIDLSDLQGEVNIEQLIKIKERLLGELIKKYLDFDL